MAPPFTAAYSAQPTFGLPCPTTIFTMGLLVWAASGVPWIVLVVPTAWSILGSSAVIGFGVIEDAMLPAANLLGCGLVLCRNRKAGGRPGTGSTPTSATSSGESSPSASHAAVGQ